MIYKLKDEEEYVISSNQVWIFGTYTTKKAANYAFRFKEEDLKTLSLPITFEDLQKLNKHLRK